MQPSFGQENKTEASFVSSPVIVSLGLGFFEASLDAFTKSPGENRQVNLQLCKTSATKKANIDHEMEVFFNFR